MTALTTTRYPVAVQGHLHDGLGRWRWMVKWFLAIPHLIVLAGLWLAFAVLTIVAGVSIAFTGGAGPRYGGGLLSILGLIAGVTIAVTRRYPQPLFDFVMGLCRWCWRVTAYAALMRDEYPPFRLDNGPDETEAAPVATPPAPSGPIYGSAS